MDTGGNCGPPSGQDEGSLGALPADSQGRARCPQRAVLNRHDGARTFLMIFRLYRVRGAQGLTRPTIRFPR